MTKPDRLWRIRPPKMRPVFLFLTQKRRFRLCGTNSNISGYLGLKTYRQDDEIFWRFEFRAFLEEIKFAREHKDFELGRKIVKIMRRVRNEIFGRTVGK